MFARLKDWWNTPSAATLLAEIREVNVKLARTVADLRFLMAERIRHSERLKTECDQLKAIIEEIHNKHVDEDRYKRLRQKLHDIRGV